jgi:hypothetical protein
MELGREAIATHQPTEFINMSSQKRIVVVVLTACSCALSTGKAESASHADRSPASTAMSPSCLLAQTPAAATANAEVAPVFKSLEELMLNFYPKAKITISGTKFHCEYKCKTEAGYYSSLGNALFPQEDGILCDASLQDGTYNRPDKDRLPSDVQDGFHTILTMAPFSKKHNKHLLVRLTYPPDASPEFKEQFETAVNEFNKTELVELAAESKAAADAATAKATADAAERKAAAKQATASATSTTSLPRLIGDLVGGKITAYLSKSDNEQGEELGRFPSGGKADLHVNTVLETGKKYYLHIAVEPSTDPDRALAGCFGLENGPTFALSGANSLDTRPAYWSVSNKGWGIECHRSGYDGNFHVESVAALKSKYPDLHAIMDPYAPAGSTGKIYYSTVINPK